MNIQILTPAKIDISNGADFYEYQSQGLGKYFLNTIFSDIESLRIYCGVHIKIENYYCLLSKRFPYAIYYKYDNETVYVYAVLDTRSNPIYTNERLS